MSFDIKFIIKLCISVCVIIFCTQIGRKLPSLAGTDCSDAIDRPGSSLVAVQ